MSKGDIKFLIATVVLLLNFLDLEVVHNSKKDLMADIATVFGVTLMCLLLLTLQRGLREYKGATTFKFYLKASAHLFFGILTFMKIRIKRFDKSIPLPTYQTPGAACMDLYSREDVVIKPKEIAQIKLNVSIHLPKGTFGLLAARSSTYKMGIIAINGIGIMDCDFGGDNDEWKFLAYNYTDKIVKIEKGTRIAQFMVFTYKKVELEEVESLDNPDRGGFGTTGHK